MLTTKEIPEISNDRTRVLPVGPLAPVNAVMLWGAAVALLITVVSMATTEWAVKSTNHMGLWRVCAHYLCVSSAYLLLGGWFNAVQAMVSFSLIASAATFGLAIVYTFVHSESVTKYLLLQWFIVTSVLSALLMVIGFSHFAYNSMDPTDPVRTHYGYSFYLAILSSIIHIIVAAAGGVQKNMSNG